MKRNVTQHASDIPISSHNSTSLLNGSDGQRQTRRKGGGVLTQNYFAKVKQKERWLWALKCTSRSDQIMIESTPNGVVLHSPPPGVLPTNPGSDPPWVLAGAGLTGRRFGVLRRLRVLRRRRRLHVRRRVALQTARNMCHAAHTTRQVWAPTQCNSFQRCHQQTVVCTRDRKFGSSQKPFHKCGWQNHVTYLVLTHPTRGRGVHGHVERVRVVV